MTYNADILGHGPVGQVTIYRYARDRGALTPRAIAEAFVAGVSEADLREFAIAYVEDWVDGMRGSGVRPTTLEIAPVQPARPRSVIPRPRPVVHEDRWSGMIRALRPVIEKYEQSVRLEVTAELLQTSFELADGSLVTWGEATGDDHEEMVSRCVWSAEAELQDAVRHRAAADMLRREGIACLNQLTTLQLSA